MRWTVLVNSVKEYEQEERSWYKPVEQIEQSIRSVNNLQKKITTEASPAFRSDDSGYLSGKPGQLIIHL